MHGGTPVLRTGVPPCISGKILRRADARSLRALRYNPRPLTRPGRSAMEYKLFIDGQWVAGGPALEVRNKYTDEVIGTVATARREDVEAAIAAAERAAPVMAEMPSGRRAAILLRAAGLLRERADDLARTIAAEAGKALKFARAEVERGISTFTIASEEAKRIHGETIPLDAGAA